MAAIATIHGREILDSRSNPTVEVEVTLDDGSQERASVPSGASTGTHEAIELRDQQPDHFDGQGVLKAVEAVNTEIAAALTGQSADDQMALDKQLMTLDGTANLSRLGANAVLGVSLAISKAAASSHHLPYFQYIRQLYNHDAEMHQQPLLDGYAMPTPMFNIINGGAHTNWQTTDFQEFMVVPTASSSFAAALETGSEIYHALETILKQKALSTLVGDEGGFAPALASNEAAIDVIIEALSTAAANGNNQAKIALDPAVSELYETDHYHLKTSNRNFTSEELINYWQQLTEKYPIMSIEDGLAEDDWQGWEQLNAALGNKILLVGDDLLVTNPDRIQQALARPTCNALLMKVNQIGTLSQALKAVLMARSGGWKIIVSHRSGETEDTSIADIAVGIRADFVKMGAPARGERTAKYNQLLRIEEQLLSH